jgi:hypothetical protein
MADIPDEEQQYLIAERLDMTEDVAFRRYVQMVWDEKAWLTKVPAGAELRRLQVTREGIQYVLARERKRRDIKMGDVQRKDSDIPKTLIQMLNAVQDDINVLVNRTQARPAASGIIAAGTLVTGSPGDPTRGTT